MRSTRCIEDAVESWGRLLQTGDLLVGDVATRRYGANTLAESRHIPAAVRPRQIQQAVEVVRIAQRYRVPLYPISTGNNWGYGSANPVCDGCVVVDLSAMDAIDDSSIELGLITVEPGVTQGALRTFLDERNLPYLVPVHGGGPNCSLMGNALERGYGITPYADHFGAVMGIEAVLPDGSIYRTPLSELGATTVDKAFKWGVGPYLDGLFSQGSFGIVTRMTIALAPAPERVETFFFGLADDTELEHGVYAVRDALRGIGGVAGSINLMNARRVLSMMEPYPKDLAAPGGIVPDEVIAKMTRRARIMPWMGIGALYGNRKVVKAARAVIRQRLKGTARRLVFVTPGLVKAGRNVLQRLPWRGGRAAWTYVDTLDKSLQLIAGAPSEIALPLAYWKSGSNQTSDRAGALNPARDGCGLVWYSPLVPMVPERVRVYVDTANDVCTQHGIEPLITLTSLSDRCFDSTVPLLFDPNNADETRRVKACYEALFEAGRERGFLPYRAGIQSMPLFTDPSSTFWQLVTQLKKAVDPHGIVAPGRYCPLDSS